MDFKEQQDQERRSLFLKANGGVSLPAAGVIYWLVVGIAGFYLPKELWTRLSLFATGAIFPLGLLLSKPLKADLMVKSPISSLFFPAFAAMVLSLPITIAVAYVDLQLVPLTLAIGMSLHWPVIGWMYNSKSCLIHAIVRVFLVTVIWFVFPEFRFTFLPIMVSLLYLFTIFGIKYELKKLK